MSFILNALRKSELEREAAQTKPLSNKLISHPTLPEKNSNSTWLMALAVVNICFLSFVLWYFFKNEPEQTEENLLSISKPIVHIEVKKPEVEAKDVRQTAAIPKPIKDFPQGSIAQQIKNKFVTQALPIIKESPIVQEKTQAEAIMVTENMGEKNTPVEVTNIIHSELVIEKGEGDNNTQTLPSNTIKSEHQKSKEPPFLSELSYKEKRSIPPISINVFVYSDKEEDRFIMVNMTKYVEGQEIEEGMMLKEIRNQSIVVEYDKQVFQLHR